MNARITRLVAGPVLVIALAACTAGPAVTPTPTAPPSTPAPTAPAASATAAPPANSGLRTAQAEPQACMDALIGGTLVQHPATGLGIRSADGTLTAVEWPFRYSAQNELLKIVLLDETGKVVAREGDEITVGGGFGNQLWHACGPVTVTRAG